MKLSNFLQEPVAQTSMTIRKKRCFNLADDEQRVMFLEVAEAVQALHHCAYCVRLQLTGQCSSFIVAN